MSSFGIHIDHAQTRVRRERLGGVRCGLARSAEQAEGTEGVTGWSSVYRDNVWVEPVTGCLMRCPAPLLPDWNERGDGLFARLSKSDYTLGTPAKWLEHNLKGFAGDVYLDAQDVNEPVVTTASWGKNRGFFLSLYTYDPGNNGLRVLDFGWGDAPSVGASSVALRLWGNGKIEVWREGLLIAENSILPDRRRSGSIGRRTVDLIVMPFKRRELLVTSNLGGSFSVAFEEIGDDEADPTITGAGKFWWSVPAPVKATVQCAPLRFATSGHATSRTVLFRKPPTGSPELRVWGYGLSGVSTQLRLPDDSGAFVADGRRDAARLRVSLTGPESSTQFVDAAACDFAPEVTLTDDSAQQSIERLCSHLTLSVPEGPEGVEAEIELTRPQEIVDGGAANLRSLANRPVRLRLGEIDVLDGWADAPEWRESVSDATRRLRLTVRDGWKTLEQAGLGDPLPMDGLPLWEALERLLRAGGVPQEAIDLDDPGLTLPIGAGISQGEFGTQADAGDSVGEWIRRLMGTYLPDWTYGFRPTADGIRFVARWPRESDEPAAVLFPTLARAKTYLIDELDYAEERAEAEAYRFVYRSFREETLEPEANEVWVTGFDWNARRPIQAHLADVTSQDATIPPPDRPPNWLGEIRSFSLSDPGLATDALVERAARAQFARLSQPRLIGEWQADLTLDAEEVPVWRGDVVELAGIGRFRVQSLAMRVAAGEGPLPRWRPTTYTGVLLT